MFTSLLTAIITGSVFFTPLATTVEQWLPPSDNTLERFHLLMSDALDGDRNKSDKLYKHIIDSVTEDGTQVKLQDGSIFNINWWYRSTAKKWKKDEQLYVAYDFYYQQIKLEHPVLKQTAWASPKVGTPNPMITIKSIPNEVNDPDRFAKTTLSNGYVFKSVPDRGFSGWRVKEEVMVLANSPSYYQLWNIDHNNIILSTLIGNRNARARDSIKIKDLLGMQERLNKKVLQQTEATEALTISLLNYVAGFKEKERPIGIFLFLGPTGVGKTELAKVLTEEIYNDPSKMLRFDMSHFTEPHSISRLIGSPPGYVNHEEGGQLTEPLLENGQCIVLLDELEKAHPQVLKAFLPVFDEGFILDSKNNRIDCSEVIFIMTSNLCGQQIAELYTLGMHAEDILAQIEPGLIQALSPELYNRVEPVLFRPLAKETMHAMVDLMLQRLVDRLLTEKEITLLIDDSLRKFLVEKGYHPLLGARPLKKLIEKRVVSELAYYIIQGGLTKGATLALSYDADSDTVLIDLKSEEGALRTPE